MSAVQGPYDGRMAYLLSTFHNPVGNVPRCDTQFRNSGDLELIADCQRPQRKKPMAGEAAHRSVRIDTKADAIRRTNDDPARDQAAEERAFRVFDVVIRSGAVENQGGLQHLVRFGVMPTPTHP